MSGETRRPFEPGFGLRKGKLKKRTARPTAIVIHTTGAGPALRASDELDARGKFDRWRARHPDPDPGSAFWEAKWVFTEASPDSGHYLIGQEGQVVQVVPDNYVARHVGSANSRAYRRPGWDADEEAAWWFRRWRGRTSPTQLAGGQLWHRGSCNGATIGIEVAPPLPNPRGPWSADCWKALGALVWDLCMAHDIPCTRDYVLTHSDAHPLARSAKGRPWDPPPSQWTWSKFCDTTGAPF